MTRVWNEEEEEDIPPPHPLPSPFLCTLCLPHHLPCRAVPHCGHTSSLGGTHSTLLVLHSPPLCLPLALPHSPLTCPLSHLSPHSALLDWDRCPHIAIWALCWVSLLVGTVLPQLCALHEHTLSEVFLVSCVGTGPPTGGALCAPGWGIQRQPKKSTWTSDSVCLCSLC